MVGEGTLEIPLLSIEVFRVPFETPSNLLSVLKAQNDPHAAHSMAFVLSLEHG